MSFPRAKIQRFNEAPSCSPAPGTYDPKLDAKVKAPLMRKDSKQTSETDISQTSKLPPTPVPAFRTPQLPRKAIKTLCKYQGRERSESSSSVDDLFRSKESVTHYDLTELECLKHKLKKTIDELNKSKDLCDLLNTDISVKMCKIEELQQKNKELNVEIETLQSNLEEAYSKHQCSLTEFESLDRHTLSCLEEIRSMAEELTDKNNSRLKDMLSLREELDNLASLKYDLEQKVTQKQQMILLLQGELSSAEVELVECRSECERQNVAASERAKEVEYLKTTIKNLEQNMDETDKQLRHMRDNLMNGSVVRENLEEQLTEKETAYLALEANYTKLQEECEFLKIEHSKEVEDILSSCEKQLTNMVKNLEAASELIHINSLNMHGICNEKLHALENKVIATISKAQDISQGEIIRLKVELRDAANQLKQEQLGAREKIESLVNEIEKRTKESSKRIKEVESEARIITEKLLRAEEELKRLSDIKDELKISDVENKLTIVELQDKIDSLTVERDSFHLKFSDAVKKCDSLKSQNKNLTVGNRNLNDSLEALRVRLLESESDVEEMTALKCALESDKRQLELALERVLLELEEQKANNAKMEADNLQQIEEVREHLLEKLESFKQKALSSSEELQKFEAGKHAQIQNLSCQLECFRQEFEMVNNYVTTLELENDAQSQQLRIFREKQKNLEQSFDALTSCYEQQTAELKQRVDELTMAHEKIAAQDKQILESKCRIEQLDANVTDSEARIVELNEALSVMEESNAEHEREIEALTEKLDHQRDCAKVATQQIANLEATKSYQEHQVQTLTSELERHKEFSHQATEHMLTLVTSNSEKEKQIEFMMEENEDLKNCLKQTMKKLEDTEVMLSSEQKKFKDLSEEIKLLEGDRFVKEEQLKDLMAEIEVLKENVHKISLQKSSLENQKLETEEKLSNINVKLITLEEEKASIQGMCDELRESLVELEAANMNLTHKCDEMHGILSKKGSDNVQLHQTCEQYENQIQLLKAEITNLNEATCRKASETQTMVDKLKTEVDALRTENLKIISLQLESAEWEKRFHEMESLIGPFKEQLEAYQAECKMLETEKGEVQEQMRELALQYAASLGHQNHKQKIRYLVKIKDQNIELREEVNKLKRTIEKLRKDTSVGSSKSSNVTHTPLVKGKENMAHNLSPVRKSPAASPNPKPLADRSTHINVI